ncbi:hypothetical protein E2C01_068027 [Portunus trituberculatus]|uniref:Uncharacterized protein n=1 Tax=Portunus trituberculatus TaxID=210409 RepID=A0A5B7HLD6_PORTR|nr:hypothetical protein [Portunus trituberculatus]
MANAVLTSFPATLRNSDLEEHELQLQWKLRIQRKFQNSRKRQDSSVTEVTSRKKKTPCIAPKETTCPLMYGVKAYLPPRPHSEDDESLERHRQWLALHWMKKGPELDKYSSYSYEDLLDEALLHYDITEIVPQVKKT